MSSRINLGYRYLLSTEPFLELIPDRDRCEDLSADRPLLRKLSKRLAGGPSLPSTILYIALLRRVLIYVPMTLLRNKLNKVILLDAFTVLLSPGAISDSHSMPPFFLLRSFYVSPHSIASAATHADWSRCPLA